MSLRPLSFVLASFVGLSVPAGAQIVRVSGTIVNERQAPIQGATVRLTGSDSTLTTGPSGTFSFGGVFAGPQILTVAAPAHEFRSIRLLLAGDTVLTVAMTPKVTALNPMVVRPKLIRIRGNALDSATGDPLLFALVSLYPEDRYTNSTAAGRFSFDKVAAGPVTIVVEAMEHLPRLIEFNATRDTTVDLRLPIDSVALRMIGVQVERLAERAQAEPMFARIHDRDMIERERRSTIGEHVDRMMLMPHNPIRRGRGSTDDACVFLDDRKVHPATLDGLFPELIERVEVYGRGAMIRVYSKRYVMSLTLKANLPKITYIPTGLRRMCE